MKHFKILITTALLLLCSLVQGRQFVDRNFVSSLGQTIPYKVAFPEAFDPAESYPVLLFLHGEAYLVEGIAYSGSVKG